MQPPSHGKDAFHRVPDFAQKRFAICHLPFAITGSACLRLCGPCVRVPTCQTSLQNSVLAKWTSMLSPLPIASLRFLYAHPEFAPIRVNSRMLGSLLARAT
jgi:hypothetical protein